MPGNTGPDVPRRPDGKWLPGASPNPSGRPRKQVEIQRMLDEEHRTIENMREVYARLKALAIGEVIHVVDKDGEVSIQLQSDPAFMKMYLDRIQGPVKDLEESRQPEDMTDEEIESALRDGN